MAQYNRVPRKKPSLNVNEEEIMVKIDNGITDHNKRTENMHNPSAIISAPIKITQKKSKMRSGIFGMFKGKK